MRIRRRPNGQSVPTSHASGRLTSEARSRIRISRSSLVPGGCTRGSRATAPSARLSRSPPDTKAILGVTSVVVHDTVSNDGTVTEDTFDWYARDREGNVWYFGGDTKEFENGVVLSGEGSWEAGVDGAKAGIIMKARPRAGVAYRQEYYRGHAEDFARVLGKSESVTAPAGTYHDVVKTKEFTPLEPKLLEHKYYARGVGVVREVTVKGGSDSVELVGTHAARGDGRCALDTPRRRGNCHARAGGPRRVVEGDELDAQLRDAQARRRSRRGPGP
jgi:hypothetical protein